MIVAIASGKGGTGKTTVAVNLALSLAPDPGKPASTSVHLLDCDVEEPNAALFLHPEIQQRRAVGVLVPEIDFAKCTYCGRCAEVCQYNAIAVVQQKVLFFPELCHGCGSCTLNCPEGAIRERLRASAVLERGTVGQRLSFAQGTLNVGEAMAAPVIRQLKQWAIPKRTRRALVILDAPPGTACPVVEVMSGCDMVLMVTEPTPFGLHDLRLAVQVARGEMGLPVAVVINRDGVGDRGVESFCAAEDIPVLMRIPMDRRIAEAYSDGKPMVEAIPEYHPRFRELYDRMREVAAP